MIRVSLKKNGTLTTANAIYGDDIHITIERESGEMYRRKSIEGNFTFVRDDFDLINNSSLDDKFLLEIYDDATLLAQGSFEKADCTLDTDNKICTIKVTSTDNYDKILSAIGNEHDLVKLAPRMETITLAKRGILQIYFRRDSKITNVIGNMSYEIDTNSAVDVENVTPEQLVGDYNFGSLYSRAVYVRLTGAPATAHPNASGLYSFTREWTEGGVPHSRYTNPSGYYFDFIPTFTGSIGTIKASGGTDVRVQTYLLAVLLTTGEYGQSVRYTNNPDGSGPYYDKVGDAIDFLSGVYARILLDTPTPSQITGEVKKLTAQDICANNLNYRYSMPINDSLGLKDLFVLSFETQDEPTRWGVDGNEKYFVRPNPINVGDNVLPVGWSKWIPCSFWFNSTIAIANLMNLWNEEWDLKEAYPLGDVLKKLLEKADDSILFDSTTTYSEFLFGDVQSISGHVRKNLYLTPTTNVKKTYHDQAARKASITLGQVLSLLRDTFQCYWFIDEQKRFRIEHISWFKNGGAYYQVLPLVDLTGEYCLPSRKEWGFNQNTIQYDKARLNNRYEFGWITDCTEAFNGFPIDINNKFTEGGRTYRTDAQGFISDVDLIMSSPDAVADDSITFICTNTSDNKCPIAIFGNQGQDFVAPTFSLQNGYLSYYYLELTYWRYDLGGNNATTDEYKKANGNNGSLSVIDTQRIKTQSVSFPLDKSLLGKEGLIKTSLGNGEWEKERYNIGSGFVEMQLILPTEN